MHLSQYEVSTLSLDPNAVVFSTCFHANSKDAVSKLFVRFQKVSSRRNKIFVLALKGEKNHRYESKSLEAEIKHPY